MNRRDFLRTAGIASATLAFPKTKRVFAETSPPAGWRTFEVTTRVEVLKPNGPTRVWLPAALITATPFQRTFTNTFEVERGTAKLLQSHPDALGIISALWAAGVKPVMTATSRVATRNYSVDLSAPGTAPKANRAELEHFLQPSKYMPTDGIVKATATEATRGAKTEVEKARAIYEWIGVGSPSCSVPTTC